MHVYIHRVCHTVWPYCVWSSQYVSVMYTTFAIKHSALYIAMRTIVFLVCLSHVVTARLEQDEWM